ncbi:MAG: hypothetical protein ACP5VP_01930 [Candidatus Limnocylindrales bacterium]
MILRVLRARVRPPDAPALFDRVSELAASMPAGLHHVTWAAQEDEAATHLLVVSAWQDMDAIYNAVGGQDLLWNAALFRGIEERLLGVEVQHYAVRGWGRQGEEPRLPVTRRARRRGTSGPSHVSGNDAAAQP